MRFILIGMLSLITSFSFAQRVCNDFYYKTFSKQQLVDDVDFIATKIQNAHANPYTEISESEFQQKVQDIKNSMKDGMTQRDFYYLAKPLLVTLNDEHSGMADFCVTDSIKNNAKALPLQFKYDNGKMILTENLSTNSKLTIGDELISLNNIPINEVLDNCAKTIPGAKEERVATVVERFWIVISKFCYFIKDDYKLKFKSGNEALVKSISLEELGIRASKNKDNSSSKFALIDYQKIDNVGYFTINAFDSRTYSLDEWKIKFDSVFSIIKRDRVKRLVIDVSNNSGGNSAIGNLLIDYFSNKSFNTYQGRWKKSQEYADFLKSLGKPNVEYDKIPNGDYLPMHSSLITASKNPLRYKGKTFVVVGKNTFSSAMMFAIIVLDNKLAKVVGESPTKGHPNHFGELMVFKTPNTNLDFLFGVKEWIRPKGNIYPNKLIPNKLIQVKNKTKREIVSQL